MDARGHSLKTKWIRPGWVGGGTISFIGIALQKIYYSLQPSNYKPCRKNNSRRKKLPATVATITATNLCLHRQVEREKSTESKTNSLKSYDLTICCCVSSVYIQLRVERFIACYAKLIRSKVINHIF